MVKQKKSGLVHAEVGEDITLTCEYRLERDTLYSIKWYRDDREFFRFIPRGMKLSLKTINFSLTLSA